MKVFISWSGTKSQEVAMILKQWIPCVIQSVEPYFSSADIDKGARWSTDIAKELQDATYGILCVTKDNLSSAWLNFEAGALSKSIDQSKVCPFLIDLKPKDIQDSPILQFQMATATKNEVCGLFKSINSNLCEAKLNEDVLNTTFETFWPKIEEALKSVSKKETESAPQPEHKDSIETIDEILELVRYQHKLLKSPTELLPPEYLSDVIRRSNRTFSRELVMETSENLRKIYGLAEKAIEDYGKLKIVEDSTSCFNLLNEIRDRIRQLDLYIRRKYREPDFIY